MPAEVVFGEWLIFDSFDGWRDAARFASWVEAEHGRDVRCPDEAKTDEALDYLMFPFEATPPIVLVRRDKEWTGERALEDAAKRFGGRFLGT